MYTVILFTLAYYYMIMQVGSGPREIHDIAHK